VAYRVPGFRATGISCGIKKRGELDLALIVSDHPTTAAGVFTRNRFPGAPVIVSRERIRRGRARAIVVNSGISNVANGARGLRDAQRMTELVAQQLGVPVSEVQVSSTGVIGRPLPMARISAGIPKAVRALSATGWTSAARAILTTDTRPKLVQIKARRSTLLGIAKGAGMIMPDLATLLVYIVTDLAVEPAFLRRALREAVGETFNRLSIDGETSTSDMVLLLANGAAGTHALTSRSAGAKGFQKALSSLCEELTQKIAADGEGVTRLAEIVVSGTRADAQAEQVARKIANSVLVKTALFGSDPNWGRIVQAVGAAGVPFKPGELAVRIGGVELLRGGAPVGGPAALRRAARAIRKPRVRIAVAMGRGRGSARVLTSDLSYEYVRINAEYTT
jgi:glutamate N-acetyltransferase/amino-acid N-acetyltransferase